MQPEVRELLESRDGLILVAGKSPKNFYDDAERIDPLREVLRYDGAVLIVHGANDTVVPVDHAHRYHAAFQCKKQLHIIPDADHTFARLNWEEEVMQVTLEWMKTHL